MRDRLPKTARLRAGAEIRRAIRRGRRVEAGPYVVHGLPATSSGGSRITVVVPRRVGAQVARNRIKRTVREAFRLDRAGWRREWDLVVYVRSLPSPITTHRAARVLEKAIRVLEATFPDTG